VSIATIRQRADATVLAPGAGVVTERLAEPGEVLPPGATLVVLTDVARPWLNVWVDEPSSQVRIGDPVTVRVDGCADAFSAVSCGGGRVHPEERPDPRGARCFVFKVSPPRQRGRRLRPACRRMRTSPPHPVQPTANSPQPTANNSRSAATEWS
jgi:HlyD family secretion protein